MSSSYSANQYDAAFRSQRLKNWCQTKSLTERPTAQEGYTTFIADDRGHLLPGAIKRGSAWPDFKGTWGLPARIPAHRINPTGRSVEGLNRLKSWGLDPQHTGESHPRRGSKNTDRLQSSVGAQQDGAAPAPATEGRPGSQGRNRTASQNQDSQAAVVGCVGQPAEDKQAPGKDRPLGQGSAAGEGTNSRPDTGKGGPASNVVDKVS